MFPRLTTQSTVIIDGQQYQLNKIESGETAGKHCIFYGNAWYELKHMPQLFVDIMQQLYKAALNRIRGVMCQKLYVDLVDTTKELPDTDGTIGIPFYDKHGFIDHAHVTRIVFEDSKTIKVWGIGYSVGQNLQMNLDQVDEGNLIMLADFIK